VAVPAIAMLTFSAADVSPVRVNVNVPGSAPASDALASVATTVTLGLAHAAVPGTTAVTVELVFVSVSFAVSVFPASSVTVRQALVLPDVGALTVTDWPLLMALPPCTHEKFVRVWPVAAALPLP
jgi:hypothetical protein